MQEEKSPAGLRIHSEDVWSNSYHFGQGIARAFIVRHGDEVLVMSASANTDAQVFEEVESIGKVSAILAPNPFHHMATTEWSQRFPDASVYANASTRKRVGKKHSSVTFKPIEELQERLGPTVKVHDTSAVMKGADAFLTVEQKSGAVYMFNDLFTNFKELPSFLPIKLAYKMFKAAPGFEPNRFVAKVAGANKPALMRLLHAAVEEHAPGKVVFSHGETLVKPDLRAAIDRFV